MKTKISEIFRSIQGEGKYLGVDQVFVRFYDCNMQCAWCDTPTSQNSLDAECDELDEHEIISRIKLIWEDCHSVSFTGGEPLLEKEMLKGLLSILKDNDVTSYLETNGVLFAELKEVVDDLDIISMDIKLPSSTGERGYWDEHAKFLKIALSKDVFIKAVVNMKTTMKDVAQMVDLIRGIDSCAFLILQPETGCLESGIVDKCLEYQKYCLKQLNDVRMIPQVHKLMGVK